MFLNKLFIESQNELGLEVSFNASLEGSPSMSWYHLNDPRPGVSNLHFAARDEEQNEKIS